MNKRYLPDYVTPPGDTLLETLEVIGMTQTELANRMGRPKKTINEIIKGKAAITPETALQLELVLPMPASFWNERERKYQETLARLEEKDRLAKWVDWLNDIPYKELVSRELIEESSDSVEMVRQVLKFFGVASPDQWRAVWGDQIAAPLRESNKVTTSSAALSAWLRQGEIKGHEIDCQPFDENRFRQALKEVRRLTTEPPEVFQQKLVKLCLNNGIAVVLAPKFLNTRVYGAARWLTPRKALIQLSNFYKSDHQFWFSFFHEAAHILLHSKKSTFIDIKDNNTTKSKLEIESEANEFAKNELIPPEQLRRFVEKHGLDQPATTDSEKHYLDEDIIIKFAQEVEISPSIVVGRLCRDFQLDYHCGSSLVTYYELDNNGLLMTKVLAK